MIQYHRHGSALVNIRNVVVSVRNPILFDLVPTFFRAFLRRIFHSGGRQGPEPVQRIFQMILRDTLTQLEYFPENLSVIDTNTVANIDQPFPVLGHAEIFCVENMVFHRITNGVKVFLHLLCHRQHALHVFHDKKFGADLFHHFNIVFIQLISRVVDQPLPVRHTEALARGASHNVSLPAVQQFIQIADHIFNIAQYDMISRRLWMIVGIGVHTAVLDVICQTGHKALLRESQGQSARSAEQIDHLQ